MQSSPSLTVTGRAGPALRRLHRAHAGLTPDVRMGEMPRIQAAAARGLPRAAIPSVLRSTLRIAKALRVPRHRSGAGFGRPDDGTRGRYLTTFKNGRRRSRYGEFGFCGLADGVSSFWQHRIAQAFSSGPRPD